MSAISFPMLVNNAPVLVSGYPYLPKRFKPHIRRFSGWWVCYVKGDYLACRGHGKSPMGAYMDWLRRARDA